MSFDTSLLSPYPAWDSCDLLFESCDRLGIDRARWARVFRNDFQSSGTYASRGPISQMTFTVASGATLTQGTFPIIRLDSGGNAGRAFIANGFYPEMTGSMSALVIVTPQRKASAKDVVAAGIWGSSAQWGIGLNYSVNPTDYKPWFAIKVSTTIYLIEDPTAWNVGDRLVLLAVREGDRLKLWKNGNLVAYGTCASGAMTVTSASLRLGEYNGNTALNTQADYEAMVLWENAIPDPQAAEISRNPYILWDDDISWDGREFNRGGLTGSMMFA